MTEDLMVDFETFGTSADSVLLSCCICLFNRETGAILEEHYQEFDMRPQVIEGLKVSPETVTWWRKENQEEFERLIYNGSLDDPGDWLREVLQLLHKKYKNIWSRGCMDAHILEHHVKGIPYWSFKDLRTMDIFGLKMQKNSHNALEDCRNQVEYLVGVLKKCTARNAEEQLMKPMESVRTVGTIGTLT